MLRFRYLLIFAVLIVMVACSSTQEVQVTKEMNEVITSYIKDHYKNIYYEDNEQFEAHKVYGAEGKGGFISVYIYSVYTEFTKNDPIERAGHSLPALIRLEKDGDTYKVIQYKEPEDGSLYVSSIKKMFPKKYVNQALNDSGNVPELHKQIDEQVQKWKNG